MTLAGRLATVVSVAIIAAARSAPAQTNATWTDARVVARALEHSPRVQTAWSAVATSIALRTFAHAPIIGNPSIGIRAMFGVPDRQAAIYGLFLGIPLDVSGRNGAWNRESRAAVEHAEADLAVARNEARSAAREAYADVAMADEHVRVQLARVANSRETLGRQTARFQAQAATTLDIALATRELAESEADLAAARRERIDAVGRFRELLDLAPNAAVAVEPLPPLAMPPGLSREAAVERAVRQRREAVSWQTTASRFRLSTDRLRAETVAPVVFGAEFEWQSYNQATVGASLQWALPIVQTGAPDRAFATAQGVAAQAQSDLTARSIAREAGAAWDGLQARLEELQHLRDEAVPSAERSLALTEVLHGSGAVDYFRVLLARRDVFALRSRLVQAQREAWRARVALDRALGGEGVSR